MTDITILNDCFDQIEKHPKEFVQHIRRYMNEGATVGIGNCANHIDIHTAHHADDWRVLYSGQNSSVYLDRWSVARACDDSTYDGIEDFYLGIISRVKNELMGTENMLTARKAKM